MTSLRGKKISNSFSKINSKFLLHPRRMNRLKLIPQWTIHLHTAQHFVDDLINIFFSRTAYRHNGPWVTKRSLIDKLRTRWWTKINYILNPKKTNIPSLLSYLKTPLLLFLQRELDFYNRKILQRSPTQAEKKFPRNLKSKQTPTSFPIRKVIQ